MTIGGAVVEIYSISESVTDRRTDGQTDGQTDRQTQATTIASGLRPMAKNALLSCSTMCVLSIDTTFMTIGAAVVDFYSFV